MKLFNSTPFSVWCVFPNGETFSQTFIQSCPPLSLVASQTDGKQLFSCRLKFGLKYDELIKFVPGLLITMIAPNMNEEISTMMTLKI